jgi:hypothetical protein
VTTTAAKTLIRGVVNEDGTFSVLGRVCSLDGTGDEQSPGEGNVLKAADVAEVTCKVFDLGTDETTAAGAEVTPAPTVVVATSVLDALRTAGWSEDRVGYNFRHDLGPAYAADPGEYRRVEYRFTLTGGGVFFVNALVLTKGVQTS